MQSVTVEGYLAADPILHTAQVSGGQRATFRVLETTRFRRADGEPGVRTTGFNCVCFRSAVVEAYIGAYARKGCRVVVQGHVENDSWTGRDGTVHYDLRLVVEALRIKPHDRTGPEGPNAVEPPGSDRTDGAADLEDEIPF